MTISVSLTDEQKQTIRDANEAQRQLIANTAEPDAIAPTQFVFFAAFDGTNNDETAPRNEITTNVVQLRNEVRDAKALSPGFHVEEAYFAGPGTKGTLTASSWLPPQVTRQVILTAERAYRQFAADARDWLNDTPGGSVTVAVTSFSRGGASAAIFSQLLYERGLQDPGDPSRYLIAPGRVRIQAGVIFDPVYSGVSGNMAFAPIVGNMIDIFAANDYRSLFLPVDYRGQAGMTTISMFGAHADIGGSYDRGIGAISLQAANEFLVRSGVPIGSIVGNRTFDGSIVLHSERDRWSEYYNFSQAPVLSLDIPGNRFFSGSVIPKYAESTTLEGAGAKKFELFDGRIITVSGEGGTTEKVRLDTKLTAKYEKSELTVFRVQVGSTSVVERIKTTSNTRTGVQTIEAIVLDSADRLNVNVQAAKVTTLSVQGAAGVDEKVALGNKLTVGSASGSVEIKGGKFKRVGSASASTWEDTDTGIKYTLVGGTLTDGRGELRVTVPGVGSTPGSTVFIKSFKNGKLGISLADEQGVEASSKTGTLSERGANTVTLKSDSISDEDRTYRVAANNLGGNLGGIVGDDIRSFAGGFIDITLPAGQKEVRFALLEQGDIDANANVTLTATLMNPDGSPVASDTISFNVEATVEPEGLPLTTRDILGDRVHEEVMGPNGPVTVFDDLDNPVTTDVAFANRQDFRVDSIVNDNIRLGGAESGPGDLGVDYVRAHAGGDDLIWQEGPGRIWAHAGAGNDVLIGGTGAGPRHPLIPPSGTPDSQDMLMGGAGDDRIYGQEMVELEAAIATGNTETPNDVEGDFLSGGAGADLIVAGNERDIVAGGGGRDVIVGGAGGDLIFGDADYEAADVLALGYGGWGDAGLSWHESGAADSPAFTVTNTNPGAVSDPADSAGDTIHAGEGNDAVLAGAGDDAIYGEAGNDRMWGDSGDDLLLGGAGEDLLVGDNGDAILPANLHGSDFLDGGEGNDTLFGNQSADVLFGGAGDDLLTGDSSDVNAGDDYLDGEDGNDTLIGAGGADTLYGGAGDDLLSGDANNVASAFHGDDALDGEAGNDTIAGGGGADIIFGGEGDDTIEGDGLDSNAASQGADTIDGGDGHDTVIGGGGADTIFGGAGADQLFGEGANDPANTAGDDFIDGGAGNDLVVGAGGDDTLYGGADDDTLAGDSDDTLVAEQGDDFLSGGDGTDMLQGYGGDDTLDGGEGADTLLGGMGEDTLSGGDGNDILLGDNGGGDTVAGDADFIDGGAGDDQIAGQGGDDALAGGEGVDYLQGDVGNDTLDGGAGGDTLLGGGGEDALAGGDGVDFLDGGAGNDTLAGGAGEDTYGYSFLNGGVDHLEDSGANTLFLHGISPAFLQLNLGSLVLSGGDPANALHLGNFDPDNVEAGAGIDRFVFDDGTVLSYTDLISRGFTIGGTPEADVLEGTSAADTINALAGDDVVIGKAGNDTIDLGQGDDIADAGEGSDTVTAGEGADLVFGGGGADQIFGEDGDDQMFGDDGDDNLDGGAGDDQLTGGEGNDSLYGGAGADALAGGAGDDTYVIDDDLDMISENADEGYDAVQSTVSFTLAGNVEQLTLTGTDGLTGTGNELDNIINGNIGANVLLGLEGNDRLYGGAGGDRLDGGAGVDVMAGGTGDDLYLVDSDADTVLEQDARSRDIFTGVVTVTSAGFDSVEASFSYELPKFVEQLTLTGAADIDGAGNVGANVLNGNAGANVLRADVLNGRIDNLVEGVLGTVLYSGPLPKGIDERLWDRAVARYFEGEVSSDELDSIGLQVFVNARSGELVDAGEGDDTLVGGWDDDALFGGDGNDLLLGSGGADTLAGGAGDDRYVVDGNFDFTFGYSNSATLRYQDEGADEVIEEAGGGSDTVYANVFEYQLPDNVEDLVLLDFASAASLGLSFNDGLLSQGGAAIGYGNDLDNTLTGNLFGNSLYGYGGEDTLVGGAGSDLLDGGEGDDAMSGGGGDDTYVVDQAGDLVIEEGSGIDLVRSGIDHVLGANVENLTLTGDTFTENLSGTGNELDNVILGNAGDNTLSGLAGNDTLDGGLGDDAMDGGAGDDTYYVDSAGDVTTENAIVGHDTVYSSVSHALGDNLEDLVLTGFDDNSGLGNVLDNHIVGNEGVNFLEGYEGDDIIEGEGGADVLFGDEGDDLLDGGTDGDTMAGGAGDDRYYVDSFGDSVSEAAGEGIDTVYEDQFFYGIGAHIENATVLGEFQDIGPFGFWSVAGNELDNVITGNDGRNELFGLGGADTIDGRAGDDYILGGTDGDTLYGGGDAIRIDAETVYLNSLGEQNSFGDGKPVVISTGTLAYNEDDIGGGEGDDAIDGGSGDDNLQGEDGDDFLYGGNDGLTADRVASSGGEEDSGGSFDFTAEGKVFLTNNDVLDGGSGDDLLDGGSGNDQLFGGGGSDTLRGGADGPLNRSNRDYLDGGDGIDNMAGGTDNDTYIVDGTFIDTTGTVVDDCGNSIPDAPVRVWTTDAVFENADEGYDRVVSAADFTLPGNVEELQLQNFTAARIGRGNAGDNRVTGNVNDNRLEGGAGDDSLFGLEGNDVLDGGAGNDVLNGGFGNDVYNFGAGYGHDTVASTGGGFDSVHLVQDIAASEITLTRQGDDVIIGLNGTTDRMVLASWFTTSSANRVREIAFCDDPVWNEATIAALANSRADVLSAVDDFAAVAEDATLIATGNVLENDVDLDSNAVLSVANPGTFAGSYGTLELTADGGYTYTLDNAAAQSLAEGEIANESFTYQALDSKGAYANAVLNVEIAGSNDAPSVGTEAAGGVVEDAGGLQRFASNQLLGNGEFEFSLDGWQLNGNSEFSGVDFLPANGNTAAFFGATGTPTLLAQEVETVAGQRYLLEFDLLGGEPAGAEFSVSWNGTTLLAFGDTGLENEYRHYQLDLEGVDGTARLEFALRNDPGYWHLDSVLLGELLEFENPPDFQQAGGTIGFSDIDFSDSHGLGVEPQGADYLGVLDAFIASDSAFGGAGQVEWLFEVDNEDLQFLAEGETLEQVYGLTLDDGHGGTAAQSVTVTLYGVNDAPEVNDSYAYVQEDDTLSVEGYVDAYDIDERDELSVSNAGTYAGTYGTLVLNADGTFTYVLDNHAAAVQALGQGESYEESFAYTVTDGIAAADATLFVEIDGQNDAPVALDDAASVGEDGPLYAAGNVLQNDSDVDSNAALTVSNAGTYLGTYGTLGLAEDGSYSYALNGAGLQSLAAGQQVQDVFSYDATDDLATSSANLTVTIGGANDAPEAVDVSATVNEDGPAVTITLVFSDEDTGDTHTIAVGAFGNTGFELGGFAGWMLSDSSLGATVSGGAPLGASYATLSSGAGQDAYTTLTRSFTLAAGETLSGLAEFVAGDALPYDDDAYVSIRLPGGASTLLFNASVTSVGDYGDTGWVPYEFVAAAAGTYVLEAGVRNTQDNSAGSRLLLDGIEQLRPATGVTLDADGTFDYDPGSRYQWLAEGETATDTLAYTVTDGNGAMGSATATVKIVGANDGPEIGSATLAATVTEDNVQPATAVLGAQGDIAFSDVDLSDAHEVQVGTLDSGYLGEFSAEIVSDSTGGGTGSVQWSFSVDNGALDAMGEGETRDQSYEVLVDDGHGGLDARIVTVTLAGVNDAPVALDDAAAVQEDGTLVASGNALGNDSDVDLNSLLRVSNPGTFVGSLGTLTLAADGSYSYVLDNAAAQFLAGGQQIADVFGYAATDGLADSSANISIGITGTNDEPVAADDEASVQEDGTLVASGNALGNDSDLDATDVLNVASPGTYVGSYGTLTLAADGTYSYALDNAAVQSLAAGQSVQDVFSYDATDGIASSTAALTVTIAGANDAPVTQDDSAGVQEDGTLVASGNLLANDSDIDGGTTLTVVNAGVYGSLDLSANGDYTYTLDNASAAVQALRAGQSVTDVFGYAATDGIASTAGSLVVTIDGTNDNPLAGNDTGAAQEDGPLVTLLASALLANDSDADVGDTKAITAVTNSAAGAQVTLVSGNAVYNVGGLFQSLRAGATITDSFSYTMADGAGATSGATVLMTITGVNDAPVLVTPIADQNATAGTAFSFSFGAGAFTDIDAGDMLTYSASLPDGTALPSWLAFNAATRTFSGTPPGGTGGGGEDDCGCGTGGGGAPETLDLRVMATDTAGASAADTFVLNIAGGSSGGSGIVPIVGTDRDDVIAGTSGNDVIDGRKGYDKMSGGAGDDVYYVDKTCGRVDLVIEGATSGYDTVYSSADYTLGSNVEELHLIGDDDLEGKGNSLANMLIGNAGDNKLRGEAGNDLLLDDEGEDRLEGGAGDDVLDGGVDDDTLIGGAGNDLYVHTKRGGDDLVQDSGGTDAIRFGTGIGASNVTVRRQSNDLLLRLSGGNGSVTVKDWFASAGKRVEQVQFADGTVWNEEAIRARVTSGGGGHGGSNDYGGGCDNNGSNHRGNGHDRDDDGYDGHHGGRHGHHDHHGGSGCGDDDCGTDKMRDAIAQRLRRDPNYDFTALAQYLQRNGGGGYGAMTAQQIAQRWSQVQNCVGSLAQADDDCGGHGGHGGNHNDSGCGSGNGHSNGGWGHSGSTGQSNGCGGMNNFSGLGEGFRRL